MTFRVEIADRAREQVRAVAKCWAKNRSGAPGLFVTEFAEGLERLTASPMSGSPYAAPRPIGLLRILMRRTRYHVYYTVDESAGTVLIRAVWHASRGKRPPLRS